MENCKPSVLVRVAALVLMVMVMIMVSAVREVAAARTSSSADQQLSAGDVSCIRVVQEDLHFSHPVSVASVSINCGGCGVSEVRLACPGPDWMQSAVDPALLSVLGNGQCLLAAGQTLGPGSTTEFAYLHSPALPLSPLSASFHC